MSAVGRGRGRGFAEVRETTLRRPGQSFSSKFNHLIDAIDNLAIEDITSGAKIGDIAQIIHDSIKDNSLEEVFDNLHKQALEERQFGIKLAVALSDPKLHSVNDYNLRMKMLQTIQKDFEDREEIKKKNVVHFRNVVSLLGEIYNSLKLNGRYMDVMAAPLLECLESLLETSEEEDVELVLHQICINGQKMLENSSISLQDLIMHVRGVLINRNLSAKSRGKLLLIVDLANQNFVPLTGKLKEFYANVLDSEALVDIQGSNKTIVESKSQNNINDKDSPQSFTKAKKKPVQSNIDNNSVNNVLKPQKQGKSTDFGNEKSPPHAGNDRPMPRAIRGAGAADKDKNIKKSPRGRKDKLTDEQVRNSKQNTSSKVWGHDDRFDKDYD